jgi:hypothetical protein
LEKVRPLLEQPLLAWVATAACALVLVAVVGALAWRARTPRTGDQVFGLSMTAMLLLSPLSWDHGLLLLALPLPILWKHLPARSAGQRVFAVLVALLWFNSRELLDAVIARGYLPPVMGPVQSLTVLSVSFYALVSLFALQAVTAERSIRADNSAAGSG